MRTRMAVLSTVLAGALLACGGPPGGGQATAKAPELITSYTVLSVRCEPAGNNVRAVVKVRMRVVNYDGFKEWASAMEMRARLVPVDSPGFSPQRNWSKQRAEGLVQDMKHTRIFTVRTEPVRPDASWKAQIKMVWDRPQPVPNVVRETSRELSCGGGFMIG